MLAGQALHGQACQCPSSEVSRLIETPSVEALVRELDVLIRARYPLIAVSTFEEQRFRRLMSAVGRLDRHVPKGLFVWSRTSGLRQLAGPGVGASMRVLPSTE